MLTSAKRIPTMFATTTARTAVRSARAIGSVAGTSAPAVLRAQSTTARAVAPLFLDLASRQPASHSLAHAPARFISIDSISVSFGVSGWKEGGGGEREVLAGCFARWWQVGGKWHGGVGGKVDAWV